MSKFLLAPAFVLLLWACQCPKPQTPSVEEIEQNIQTGNYEIAHAQINNYLIQNKVSDTERLHWQWKQEWMRRVAIDFHVSDSNALQYIRRYYPDLDSRQVAEWEKSRALEGMMLNGEKRYFDRAARNLFRIDSAAYNVFAARHGFGYDSKDSLLWRELPQIINQVKKTRKSSVAPQSYKITYTLTVPAGSVPAGEILRVWMPLPRTDCDRQSRFALLHTSQPNYIVSPDAFVHKSIYMEHEVREDEATVFQYQFQYTARAQWFAFDPEDIRPYDTESELYKTYTAERLPHIILSERIKTLAQEITRGETNPYRKLCKLFTYINDNFPWAGAREYSTIDCIPHYVLDNRHGDCGQLSLLLISLCRAVGIPAQWESGWMLHPGCVNLHDWAKVYFEGIGWVPVDQSFGLQYGPNGDYPETRPETFLFFTRGMDPYRLVANNDISGAFYPAKIFPRSETVDFQRGEVEWRGGNLYFDQWDYDMEVTYLNGQKTLHRDF